MTCNTCSGSSEPAWAYIAIGSNTGDSISIVRRALDDLRQLTDRALRCSSLYRTEPVDCPSGSPWFINAVAGLAPRPGVTPESLLAELQTLEVAAGRLPKKILNESRPLDLDLIAFGHECRDTPKLILPHPRAWQRRFVLQPWAEIEPDFVPPGQSLTVEQLLKQLGTGESVYRLEAGQRGAS